MRPSGKSLLWTGIYIAAVIVLTLLAWWPSWARDAAASPADVTQTPPLSQENPTNPSPTLEIAAQPSQEHATPQPSATSTLTATLTPEETSTPTATLTPEETPTPTATATITVTDTATPTATGTATPRPTATPTRPMALLTVGETPEPHLWLARPVREDAHNRVERYYPYGATGQDQYPLHHGVEFINPTGTQAVAVGHARVEVAGHDDEISYSYRTRFYGQLVILRLEQRYNDQPVFALYGHLSKVYVQEGQLVDPGEPLGEIGMSGVALGPHLHFEVRVGENSYWDTRNPELWLDPLPGQGVIAGRVVGQDGQLLPEVAVAISRAEAAGSAWRQAWTYTTRDIRVNGSRGIDHVNPDDGWTENGVMGDVPAGTYVVGVRVNGQAYTQQVTVRDGEISYVVLVTE